MSKMFVKTGDTVMVLSGKSKGVKPRKMGEPGGLIDVESALYASKVQLVCPKCGEATRVGHKDSKRVCKKCGNEF